MGNELKRMRYFDGLLLDESDYTLDQEYQRRIMQLHNRFMHTNGIATGLEVIPSIAELNNTEGIALSKVECTVETEEGKKVTYYVPNNITDEQLCEAIVTEGMALDVLKAEENKNSESISRQIYIGPDNKVDLSGYDADQNIYLYVYYMEKDGDTEKDRRFIRGQEQVIHTLELGCIGHDLKKPEDEDKNIILGRVVLGLAKETTKEVFEKNENDSKDPEPTVTKEFEIAACTATTIDEKTNKKFDKETGQIQLIRTETITSEKEKKEVTTTTTTYENDDDIKQITIEVNGHTTDTQDKIIWKKNETVVQKIKKDTGELDSKTIDSTIEEGNIKTITHLTSERIIDQTTNKPAIKTTGKTTVTNIVEIKDETTGAIIETKEITTETEIDNTTTEDDSEIDGQIQTVTKGTNTVTTTVKSNNENTNQSEQEIQKIAINIEETTIKGEDETLIFTVTTEDTEEMTKTTNVTKTIVREVDEYVGIATITTKVETRRKIEYRGTSETNETNLNEYTEETITEKEPINGLEAEYTCTVKVNPVKYIKEVSYFDSIDSASSEDASSEDASSEDASSEDASSENASSEDASSEDASSEDASSEDTSSEDTSSEDASSEDASSEDTSSEDASSDNVLKVRSLRKYSGPGGNELIIEKMIFKTNDQTLKMPSIRTHEENEKIGLEVDSPYTNFNGSVTVKGDLIVKGQLIDNGDTSGDGELSIANSFVQVNSKGDLRDGGLQVYRGETEESPDACLRWSEERKKWQVGFMYKDKDKDIDIDKDFYDIAYGDKWEKLINRSIADDLHRHSKLYDSSYGVVLEVIESGDILVNRDLSLNDKTLWLRSSGNTNHGLGWYGTKKEFDGISVDGPVLFGLNGGILGTTENGQKAVITWNSAGNVGIGVKSPIDDRLELGGTLRILSDTNPIRFTSKWKGINDPYIKNAEISNDTSTEKALVIVGNSSAGFTESGKPIRKVAIWDRLDVNGKLDVKNDVQVTNTIKPSSGNGKNGIVFSEESQGNNAWLKYYAQSGEACILEIRNCNSSPATLNNISFMASGNVGIGTNNPLDKLDVSGSMRVLSGSNPIRFTSVWDGTNGAVINQAEICNDTSRYKSLILVGNKSSGRRKVSVWDDLDVNGSLTLNGDLKTQCAITPSAGKGENSGITFPKEYNGDKGDSAWIKYYSDEMRGGKENMTLEIGIGDDAGDGTYNGGGDRIRLYASGGVYVDGYFYLISSREVKENIKTLPTEKAKNILNGLNPVSFNFIGDTQKTTLGFIAEEVPEEVAAIDQKAISPMEIVTVLTSVVKEQRKLIDELQQQVESIS